jgi:hypothetical protein
MNDAVTADDLAWFAEHGARMLRRPALRLVSSQPEYHVDRRGTNRKPRRLQAVDSETRRWTLQLDRRRAKAL